MVNQVRFTPLCGSGGGEAPHCYLLEIEVRDGAFFTLLLDAGWDDALSPALVEPLKRCGPIADVADSTAGVTRRAAPGGGRRHTGSVSWCALCPLRAPLPPVH